MRLTTAQLQTVKAWVIANNNSVFGVSAVNALNAPASPDYLVWETKVSRAKVYHSTGKLAADGTDSTWNWETYKAQQVPEQNAWTQMFMGDEAPMSLLNFRKGVFSIFKGSAPQNAQRNHIFGTGRRKTTLLESLLAVAVTGAASNGDDGNEAAQPRGSLRNPDNLGTGSDGLPCEGPITLDQVVAAESA